MPELGDCPSSEEMAALVEGVGPDGRWQELIVHLRRCPECYAVFTEARKLRRDSRGNEGSDRDR